MIQKFFTASQASRKVLTIGQVLNASIIFSLLLGSALPVMAVGNNSAAREQKNIKTMDIACMINAVDKRDTAILSAFDAFSTAIKNALLARKDALKAAWGNADVKMRREAIGQAWETYRKSVSKARKDWRMAKHAAWKQFYEDRKACGPGTATSDNATQAVDNMI